MGRAVDITVINPTDYFLYMPLLPRVTGGILDPRRVAVSLTKTLPGVRVILGQVGDINLGDRSLGYIGVDERPGRVSYDRLVVAVGSVNKLLPIPGIADYAHGYRNMKEALYLPPTRLSAHHG
jgi:NADH:ubiquinone reductase (H+-translocating)